MGEWKPIDTAPLNEPFLVWDGSRISIGQRTKYHTGRIGCWNIDLGEDEEIYRASHWMPLPQPPSP